MLNVMSESPVADGRCGLASRFSSSSESSITLRFVISEYTQRLVLSGQIIVALRMYSGS